MKTKIAFCFLILFLIPSVFLSGQKSVKKITLWGIVKDSTDSPVVYAVILIDGKKTGYLTDEKGYYKVKVKRDNTRIGVQAQSIWKMEELINGRDRIDFKFEQSIPSRSLEIDESGEESVDMGLKKVKKKSLTSPVNVIDGTQSKYASYSSIYDMIRSEVPGVMVQGNSIMIRSATSINASNEPLFVVDGVPVNSIDYIRPQMVKSIQVLKGSSASIYGLRGSNGVIVINLLKAGDN